MMDREADFVDLFGERKRRVEILARAKHDRNPDPRGGKLFWGATSSRLTRSWTRSRCSGTC